MQLPDYYLALIFAPLLIAFAIRCLIDSNDGGPTSAA